MNNIFPVKDNITLDSAYDIQEFCQPLFHATGLNYFHYFRLYNDGYRIAFCSNAHWIEHFYQQKYYNFAKINRHPSCYKKSFYAIWDGWEQDCESNLIVGLDAKNNFNQDHGCSMVVPHKCYCEIFEFATSTNNIAINNFYLNHLEILEKFNVYFKDHMKYLINEAIKTRFRVEYDKNIDIYSEYRDTFPPDDQQIVVNNYTELMQQHALTSRECECIDWLLKGKTAEEVSLILSISNRTAEKHIANIKEKLNCRTLLQLGVKLAHLLRTSQ